MDTKNIEQQVKLILADKLDVALDKVTPQSLLVEDMNMDSFRAIEMAFALEEKFNISIPDSDISTVKTVQDVISYIQTRC